jgi:hypothetical protein
VYTLVETIQRHFPEKSAKEIIAVANRVLREISRRTGYGSRDYTLYTTTTNQMYYQLNAAVRRVDRVDLDDEELNRVVGIPAGQHRDDAVVAGGGGIAP